MNEDSTSQVDDVLGGWNYERAKNKGTCNIKHHILKKQQKKVICRWNNSGKNLARKKGNII